MTITGALLAMKNSSLLITINASHFQIIATISLINNKNEGSELLDKCRQINYLCFVPFSGVS